METKMRNLFRKRFNRCMRAVIDGAAGLGNADVPNSAALQRIRADEIRLKAGRSCAAISLPSAH